MSEILEQTSGQDLPYTNRELRDKWHELANSQQNILAQTTKTNGTVADINRWRERINGGALVAGVFMTFVVVPILGWSLYVLVNIDTTVHQAVDQALSAYKKSI